MMILKTIIMTAAAFLLSTAAIAGPQQDSAAGTDTMPCDILPGGCDIPPDNTHCGLLPGACGTTQPAHWGLQSPAGIHTAWSLFDPYLLDIPGGGKGIPVHDANDATKIIGYVKMPERPKPTGPVHCMIKQTGLLAKSVDDCEAAGGTVAK